MSQSITSDPVCCRISVVAKRWDCSHSTIRRMVETGELPAIRLGRLIRIPMTAIIEAENKPACQKPQPPASAASKAATRGTSITNASASLRAARIGHRLN
ncbi:helix-turn-helix domain-containing protein [Gluconobacter kondonii]|nr:helix-turn-helix domain-containing protein [Gluconobacter kondonii]